MSKSYGNTIPIFATGKPLKNLVMSIVTDSKELEDVKDPDTCNVYAIYKLFANEEQIAQMRENYARGGYGYGHAKKELLTLLQEHFADAHERRATLEKDPDFIEDVLHEGARRAREVARGVLDRARQACGIA